MGSMTGFGNISGCSTAGKVTLILVSRLDLLESVEDVEATIGTLTMFCALLPTVCGILLLTASSPLLLAGGCGAFIARLR